MINKLFSIVSILSILSACSNLFEQVNPSLLETRITRACAIHEENSKNSLSTCIELRINKTSYLESFAKKCIGEFRGVLSSRCTYENVTVTCDYPQESSGNLKHFYYNSVGHSSNSYRDTCLKQRGLIVTYNQYNYSFVFSPVL